MINHFVKCLHTQRFNEQDKSLQWVYHISVAHGYNTKGGQFAKISLEQLPGDIKDKKLLAPSNYTRLFSGNTRACAILFVSSSKRAARIIDSPEVRKASLLTTPDICSILTLSPSLSLSFPPPADSFRKFLQNPPLRCRIMQKSSSPSSSLNSPNLCYNSTCLGA